MRKPVYANNKGRDHPCSLISTIVVPCLDSLIPLLAIAEISRPENLSHLSAQVVNRLLRENRKSIPKFLSSKKLLKNVTLQILNFIPVS